MPEENESSRVRRRKRRLKRARRQAGGPLSAGQRARVTGEDARDVRARRRNRRLSPERSPGAFGIPIPEVRQRLGLPDDQLRQGDIIREQLGQDPRAGLSGGVIETMRRLLGGSEQFLPDGGVRTPRRRARRARRNRAVQETTAPGFQTPGGQPTTAPGLQTPPVVMVGGPGFQTPAPGTTPVTGGGFQTPASNPFVPIGLTPPAGLPFGPGVQQIPQAGGTTGVGAGAPVPQPVPFVLPQPNPGAVGVAPGIFNF